MTFLSSNIFLAIFSAQMLKYLWGMINVLQTIVLSALFNVQIPLNADMVMVAILQLVSADVVDVDPWIEYLHEFRETEPFFLRYD